MPRGASEKLGGWGQQGPAPAHRLSVEVSKYSALQHSHANLVPKQIYGRFRGHREEKRSVCLPTLAQTLAASNWPSSIWLQIHTCCRPTLSLTSLMMRNCSAMSRDGPGLGGGR